MATKWELETGIEIPSVIQRRETVKYPLRDMKVGDSFFIKASRYNSYVVSNRLSGAFEKAKKYGLKFTRRRVDGGVRVWRIE